MSDTTYGESKSRLQQMLPTVEPRSAALLGTDIHARIASVLVDGLHPYTDGRDTILQNQIDQLKIRVADLENRVSAAESRISVTEARLNVLEPQVTQLQQQLAGVQGQLNSGFSQLNSQINQLASQLASQTTI